MKTKTILLVIAAFIVTINCTNAQWQQSTAPTGNSVDCLSALGTNVLAGTDGGGIIMSSDSGANWIVKNTGISNLNIRSLGADTNGNLYAGSNSLTLYTSIDTGNYWTSHNAGGTGTSISSFTAYGAIVFLGEAGDGVFTSVDNGVSWSEVGLCCASVLSLSSDQYGYVYAGTITTVYRSNGTFTNWTQMNNGLPANSVRALAGSGSLIFAGTYGNGVYVSANNGTNWTQVNNGLADLHVISLAANGSKIFAGTDAGGVFLSVDNGVNWLQVNEALSYLNIPSLVISGSYLYAGTTTGGIWKRPLSEFTVIEEINGNTNLSLYPNPANDIVTLNIDRDHNAILAVNIYNVFGTLVTSEFSGQNQINVGHLSNGIYVVEIRSEKWTEKQKLIIKR